MLLIVRNWKDCYYELWLTRSGIYEKNIKSLQPIWEHWYMLHKVIG